MATADYGGSRRSEMPLTDAGKSLRHDLLHRFEDRAAARHPVAPHPVEIGDQRLDVVASAASTESNS
jgi:hypothetical protein